MTDKKKAYNRAYYLAHKSEIVAQHREYRATPDGKAMRKREKANRKKRYPEKVRAEQARYEKSAKHQKYLADNRDAILVKSRDRQHRNRKKYAVAHKEWMRKNGAAHRAKLRAIPGYHADRNRIWRAANPEKARLNHNRKWHKRRAIKNNNSIPDNRAVAAKIKFIRTAEAMPCRWCGKITVKGDRHVDHIIPLNRGGPHSAENLCCACPRCNCSKGDKLPHEFSP